MPHTGNVCRLFHAASPYGTANWNDPLTPVSRCS